MKAILSLFLALLLFICCIIPAWAAEDDVSGCWSYLLQNDRAIVTGYTGGKIHLDVPDTLDGYPVVAIGTAAFYRSDIEEITIPSGVREIGWWAFYGASRLRTVHLLPGLQTISFGAFLNCTSLHSIALPWTVSLIGADAFAVQCTTVTGVPDVPNDRLVGQQHYSTDVSFKMAGFRGTAAEKYAEENNLIFYEEGEVYAGDVNADGVIDCKDISLMERHLDGDVLLPAELRNADLDGDGVVIQEDCDVLYDYVNGQKNRWDLPVNRFLAPSSAPALTGKQLYSDGDSVAKGTGTDTFGNSFYSYAHYLAERYHMNLTNNAVGGTTIAKVKKNPLSTGTSILERVESMRDNYDVILLDGGFNDMFLNVAVGEVTSESDRSGIYDVFTTAGALERICYFLTKNYPSAVKLFVLCHICDEQQAVYRDVICRVLKKWGIPYVDIAGETDFRAVNEEINNQYFFCNNSAVVADGIHPVAYAQQKVYGAVIEKKLALLFADQNTLTVDKEHIDVTKGATAQLTLRRGGLPYDGVVSWTSSDSEIVSVHGGIVTANAVGGAVVRAETPDGEVSAVQVTVKQMPLCFYLNQTEVTLERNQCISLVPVFLKGSTAQDISYQSSDSSVAQVGGDGVVTAKTGGSAVITCKLPNGVKTKCLVIVR